MDHVVVLSVAVMLSVSVLAQEGPKAPAMLKVDGNGLATADGKEMWLQGLNVPSMEWSAEGENVLKSTEVAIRDWHANVIRLPLSQDRWFGKTDQQKDEGKAYRELVDQVVALGAGKGVYVVIDLHWSNAGVWGKYMQQKNMPDPHSLAFWQDVAKRYANHPAVLFDLYNEPRNVTWEVWRNGGEVTEKADNGDALAYRTPGMQGLVDAVRATGAKNVVIAGGLDWAYDLSGVLKGFALDEKGGNGIMYATHIYPWKSQWEQKVGRVAEKYPVLVGEVGCEPDKAQENPYTWGPDMLGYIQKKKLHWTGWCFHPSASPRMLLDWEYTPTPYWGAFAKAALLGAKFEVNRTR